jgi:hypothetical protein
MADPVFQALGLQEFAPSHLPQAMPRGDFSWPGADCRHAMPGMLPTIGWPPTIGGLYEPGLGMAQAFPPAWPSAAALNAAAAAMQDSLGRGGPPLSMQELAAFHSACAVAAATAVHASLPVGPLPHSAPTLPSAATDAPAFLPLGLAGRTVSVSSTMDAVDKQRDAEDLAILELDEAVSRLLQGSDGSGVGSGARSDEEVPTTPLPQKRCDMSGTPVKVSLSLAEELNPEPPPGLALKHQASSPVVLSLSSMAFPGGSGVNEASNFHLPLLPLDGWDNSTFCAVVDEPNGLTGVAGAATFLSAPPGLLPEGAEDKEAGNFLLNLLRTGSGSDAQPNPAADAVSVSTKALSGSAESPTDSSTASPVSAATAEADSPSRRPTRRGRRAGQTRYH